MSTSTAPTHLNTTLGHVQRVMTTTTNSLKPREITKNKKRKTTESDELKLLFSRPIKIIHGLKDKVSSLESENMMLELLLSKREEDLVAAGRNGDTLKNR